MKKASILLVFIIFFVLLCSCSMAKSDDRIYTTIYHVTELPSESKVYVDQETGVMYYFIGGNYGAGLSLMLNRDGSPKIYDESSCMYNVIILGPNNMVYVDPETGVMYLFVDYGHGGGISPMYNSNGSLRNYYQDFCQYDVKEINLQSRIYVDEETNVMYWYNSHEKSASFTVLLDSNGFPRVYDRSLTKFLIAKKSSENTKYVDVENNVMYWYLGNTPGGGVSIMLNPDGSPKIFNEETTNYPIIKMTSKGWFYVDTDTDVMYWYIEYANGGGSTTMYNPDGTPKLAK